MNLLLPLLANIKTIPPNIRNRNDIVIIIFSLNEYPIEKSYSVESLFSKLLNVSYVKLINSILLLLLIY